MKYIPFVLLFGLITACSSPTAVNLDSLLAPNTKVPKSYSPPEILARDVSEMDQLEDDLKAFSKNAVSLKAKLSFRDESYFTQDDVNRTQQLLFHFTALRNRFSEKYEFYKTARFESPNDQARAILLGMRAGLNMYYIESRLAVLFYNQGDIADKLNTAYAPMSIERNTLRSAFLFSTKTENIDQLQVAWMLLGEITKKSSEVLSQLIASDPVYCNMLDQLKLTYADTALQTDYLVQSSGLLSSHLYNQMRHTQLARISRELLDRMERDAYSFQGFTFKNVARIHWPAAQPLSFSESQIEQVIESLQPGDVILTYTSGYMSNVFLPGMFKHGITYIGTPEQRIQAGLTPDRLRAEAASPEQAETLLHNVANETTSEGISRADCIEAVSEGVKFSSLRHLMETHISRMVVLRPNLDKDARSNQLIELFQHLGVPYDFNFDFSNAGELCCTELVYRTLSGKGNIDLSFEKTRGKWVLTADDIVRYCLEQPNQGLNVVLLVDQSSDRTIPSFYMAHAAEQSLRKLMNLPTATETQ